MNFSIKKINKFNDTLDSLKIAQVERNDDVFYKGIILDTNNSVVMTNFSHTQEFVFPSDLETFCSVDGRKLRFFDNVTKNKKSYKSFVAEEGTLIRIFVHNDNWYISTQSRLDAYKSFWSNNFSFGVQFENFILESNPNFEKMSDFYDCLDETKQYVFLLPTTQNNRIGKKYDVNETKIVYLVGVRDRSSGTFTFGDEELLKNVNLKPLEQVTIENRDDLVSYMSENKNIIFYFYDESQPLQLENLSVLKCLNEEYDFNCKLRNNEYNLEYRYVELLLSNPAKLEKFCQLFPDNDFKDIDDNYNKLISYIHTKYIERYVKHQFEILPKYIHYILKMCHKNYKTTRVKTTRLSILGVLLSLKMKFVYYVYKEFFKTK